VSSATSTQVCRGEPSVSLFVLDSGALALLVLTFLNSFFSLGVLLLTAGGVPGRLCALPALLLPLLDGFAFPGVLPSPSSFRNASAVSAPRLLPSHPVFWFDGMLRTRPESEAGSEVLDGAVDTEVADKYEGAVAIVVPGGVLAEAKLLTDPDPRRNWLIEALEGLGGRWEKSFGAKCLKMSW